MRGIEGWLSFFVVEIQEQVHRFADLYHEVPGCWIFFRKVNSDHVSNREGPLQNPQAAGSETTKPDTQGMLYPLNP